MQVAESVPAAAAATAAGAAATAAGAAEIATKAEAATAAESASSQTPAAAAAEAAADAAAAAADAAAEAADAATEAAEAAEEMTQPELPMEEQRSTLSEEQLLELRAMQVRIRIENEEYLAAHPELSELLLCFLTTALQQHEKLEKDGLLTFAGRFFTQPNLRQLVLKDKIEQHQTDNNTSSGPHPS